MTIDYHGVLEAWDREEAEQRLHPTWREGVPVTAQDAFWQSGWDQTGDVVDHAGEGARVLDFGAGNGRITIPLAKLGFETWAIDASPTMLDKLRANADTAGVNVRTVQSDGTSLTTHLGRKKADVIVCRAVLIQHNYEDGTRIIEDLSRVLKKNGVLIADWPTGEPQVRSNWLGVTVWDEHHRARVAKAMGLEPVRTKTQPTVWRKA